MLCVYIIFQLENCIFPLFYVITSLYIFHSQTLYPFLSLHVQRKSRNQEGSKQHRKKKKATRSTSSSPTSLHVMNERKPKNTQSLKTDVAPTKHKKTDATPTKHKKTDAADDRHSNLPGYRVNFTPARGNSLNLVENDAYEVIDDGNVYE